jgi:hypothetical protein
MLGVHLRGMTVVRVRMQRMTVRRSQVCQRVSTEIIAL